MPGALQNHRSHRLHTHPFAFTINVAGATPSKIATSNAERARLISLKKLSSLNNSFRELAEAVTIRDNKISVAPVKVNPF